MSSSSTGNTASGSGGGASALEASSSSVSSRTTGSSKEQKKIEQIVLETLFRLVETVLVNRLPQEDLDLLDPSSQDGNGASGSTYAKLQLRLLSLLGLRNAMKDWKDDIYKPLQLEIWGMKRTSSSSSEDTADANVESSKAVLLELYYIHYRPRDMNVDDNTGTSDPSLTVIKDMHALYTRLSVLIRSLYASVVALPAEQYRRDEFTSDSSDKNERITYVLKVPVQGPPNRESAFGYDQPASVVTLPSTHTEYGVLECYFMYHMQPQQLLKRYEEETTTYHVQQKSPKQGLLNTGLINNYATLGEASTEHQSTSSKEEEYTSNDVRTLPREFVEFDVGTLRSDDILNNFPNHSLFSQCTLGQSSSRGHTRINFRRATGDESSHPPDRLPELPVMPNEQGSHALKRWIDQRSNHSGSHRAGRTSAHAKGAELIAMAGASTDSSAEQIGISPLSESTCDYTVQVQVLDKLFNSLEANQPLDCQLEHTLAESSRVFNRLHSREEDDTFDRRDAYQPQSSTAMTTTVEQKTSDET
eukprot:gb/GECG01006033.1/.p1 GENE.gb/GECG01006033.1/~~gb/GECG01006033.1/.p1  ORF type:complete len:531 (+),score=77.87 gb/GECG01006033.1/:1-1593(+)